MILFWILNFLTFLILRLPSLFEPYWYADEGIYLTIGNALRRGEILYSQIHDNKPPLLYHLAALAQTTFGFRLLLFFVMIPTIIYFYKLARYFFNHRLSAFFTFVFTVVTSIPYFEGHIANAEIFMLLPTIIGIYFLLKNKLFLSGLGFGIAFAIKAPVIIEAIFGFLWILFFLKSKTKIKDIIFYILACLLPISLYALYFLFKGVFSQFFVSALLLNFGYLSSWQTGSMQNSPLSGGLSQRAIILFIGWLIIYFLNKKKILNSKATFLLAWFSATIFGSLLSGRPYPHYLIQVLPPLTLLIGFLPLFIFALSIFIFIVVQFKFYFYKVISYYQNFYLNDNNPAYFGSHVSSTYQIAAFIKQNTLPSEKIFIWGDEPCIYALSDRLPACRYTVAYHVADFNAYQETINDLNKQKPKYIIYFTNHNRSFKELDNLINEKYDILTQIDSALIFKLK